MSGRRSAWGAAGVLALAVVAVIVVVATTGSSPRRARPVAVPTTAAPTTRSSTTAVPTAHSSTTPIPLAPGRPAPGGTQFGAAVNRLFNDGTFSPAQIAAQLSALHATGATLARADALWEATEPTAPAGGIHHYDWSFDDAIAGDLAAAHLTWLPILDYSAPWAQSVAGQDHSPPRSDADYAAYAGAFAARYGAGGSFWSSHPELTADPVTAIEIWNEPDNAQFWYPTPDPAAYAGLYLAARTAIDAVDPSARALVGGLVHPADFLPAMLRATPALAGHIDGIAIHPYGTPPVVLSRIAGARAALTSLGMHGVPLYITELGWTTSPPGAQDYVAEARRPGYIRSTLAALGHTDCGLAAAVLYTWVTPERDPADSGDWYGIQPPGATAPTGPDAAAFADGLRAAGEPASARPVCGS